MTGTQKPLSKSGANGSLMRCWVCGSADQVQRHHPGGKNHVPWFKVPLCLAHHDKVTTALRLAGVEMEYTPDKKQRFRRILQALWVFQWLIMDWYFSGE
jgi:hypothetical protein